MQTIINLIKWLKVLGQFTPEETPEGLVITHVPSGCSVQLRNDGSLITHAPFNNVALAEQSVLLNVPERFTHMTRAELQKRQNKLMAKFMSEGLSHEDMQEVGKLNDFISRR